MDITQTNAILESISDGVFTVDLDWRVTSFNRAAEEITGIQRSEAIGRLCSEVLRANLCEQACALRKTLENGTPVINKMCFIINAQGERIPISISTAVLRDAKGRTIGGAETFRDLRELEALRQKLTGKFTMGDLVSRSESMRKVFELVPAISSTSSTVLVQGETGTGKELLARAIHGSGPRAEKPFVAINCGALPDTLLESELFGYKKGAFTGAVQDKSGRFAQAADGTLFLDEIGDISPAMQVRLLRVLQERRYEPLGSSHSEHTEARIVAATNHDLAELVKQGTFREDLFYRINVIRVDLPPLRQRKEDIPLLVDHFIERFNRMQHKHISGLATDALFLLMAHDWPGNVRELENIIERSFILCAGKWITLEHLPEEMTRGRKSPVDSGQIKSARRMAEAQTIANAMKRHHHNRLAAARELGIHKTTLYRKLKILGINFPKKDGRSSSAWRKKSR
ncbi:sigma 54-interacting transcriptional regulator [candidate division FCPU426 bacterium]|nr:sigma 54-interacting transcriptional regulator [candidate division FCPU426 bacterium]